MKESKTIYTLIFLGSLWGISEATIGYGCHLITRLLFLPGMAGFFMFPVAFFFMFQAYKQTGTEYAPLLTGLVAASIKLLNLFLPTASPVEVMNPVMAIIAESAIVFLVIKTGAFEKKQFLFLKSAGMSTAWRIIFVLVLLALPFKSGFSYYADFNQFFRFFIVDSLINGVLILVTLKKTQFNAVLRPFRMISPRLSFATFAVAICLGLILN